MNINCIKKGEYKEGYKLLWWKENMYCNDQNGLIYDSAATKDIDLSAPYNVLHLPTQDKNQHLYKV